MEHLSLYKNGEIAFTYDEPEVISAPIEKHTVFQYLQDTVKLERAYTIRDFIQLVKSYPELMKIHNYAESLIEEVNSIPKIVSSRNHRLNYVSFECIHEIYYVDDHIEHTETYTNLDIYSGQDNEIVEHILDFTLSEIIDLPIVIRQDKEYDENMERVYIDNVSFLNFAYELIDFLSYTQVSKTTDLKIA